MRAFALNCEKTLPQTCNIITEFHNTIMTLTQITILLTAGLISGIMNALAGGGSFIAFPALILLQMAPIEANATASLAVFPGTLASMLAYRRELLRNIQKMPLYIFLSLAGGAIGAIILLQISNDNFAKTVPYLLLTATLLFTYKKYIIRYLRNISVANNPANTNLYQFITLGVFLAISIYGGFFGAGMGIMLLALFSFMSMENIHEMNSLRTCFGLCANIIAIIIFALHGMIIFKYAAIMAIGGVIGGFFGAYYALKLPQSWSRNCVVIIAWGMTIYFFWKQFV